MGKWLKEMVVGFWTILVGMSVTIRHLFKRPVTMFYPEERWQLPEGYRGLLKCDVEACIACELCIRACPVEGIKLQWKREEGKPGKICTSFTIDYQKCMYCGLCVEPCPRGAIFHSEEYENSVYQREELLVDWATPSRRIKSPKAKLKTS
jgi:NADH-quinone oxidoreductase subunit I/NAD(P)H-quinone oxidoreductase subunit I